MMKNLIALIFAFNFLFFIEASSQIIINEVCSTNGGHYYDENNKTPDWIELYNNSDQAVNLKGWRIYDKNEYDNAYVLPDTVMQPRSYLIVHCSGENRVTKDNFIIRSSGYGIVHYDTKDYFNYFYLPCEGDFEMQVNLRALKAAAIFDKAGLMFREELETSSKYWGVFGQIKSLFQFRFMTRQELNKYPLDQFSEFGLNYPYTYLMLKRSGDSIFTAIVDSTGFVIEKRIYEYPSNKKLYAGIAVAALKPIYFTEAVFRDLKVNKIPTKIESLNYIKLGTFPDGYSYYGGEIHTEFKLSSEGETVYLWNNQKSLKDKMTFPINYADYSFGRSSSDNNTLKYFDVPSPAKANSVGQIGILEEPIISLNSGWFDTPQTAYISHNDKSVEIYYTLNGSDVDKEKSIKYNNEPIFINRNMSIRAKAFKAEYIQSKNKTNTYFIKDSFNLPVISIVADSMAIFGDHGIFSEKSFFSKDEIPVQFQYWENDGSIAYHTMCGMRLTGQNSKYLPQQSFRLYAREKFNNEEFDYNYFNVQNKNKYRKLWLRTGSSDWDGSLIRDYLTNVLFDGCESLYRTQVKPVVVYINGDYRGIYFLREYFDEDFIEDLYNIDKSRVNFVGELGFTLNGSGRGLYEVLDCFKTLNMNDNNAYDKIGDYFDIENFLNYTALQFTTANTDWGVFQGFKNVKMWQSDQYDGKWRMIVHDNDFSLNSNRAYVNMYDHIRNENQGISELLLILLKNDQFRNLFINRNADFINSRIRYENVSQKIDSLSSLIAKEIPRHKSRWEGSAVNWEDDLENIRKFPNKRRDHFWYHTNQEFNLSGIYHIAVNDVDTNQGYIKLNSLDLMTRNWSGFYFNDVPISLSAIAYPGFSFENWGHIDLDNRKSQNFAFNQNSVVYPKFITSSSNTQLDPIVNEIMYKASDAKDCKDWVEIYNPNPYPIDVSSWVLKDDNDKNTFKIPANTQIRAKGYLIIAENIAKFKSVYPSVSDVVGDFPFGLSSTEDMVRLFDDKGKQIDMVQFTSKKPWDPNANGTGRSLELIDPLKDNNRAENWKASDESFGTPGRQNSIYVGIEENYAPESISAAVYPNPAIEFAKIFFASPRYDNYTIELFDYKGSKIKTIYSGYVESGSFLISTELNGLSNGIYFINIKNSQELKSIKFIVG